MDSQEKEKKRYELALTLVPGIGCRICRLLYTMVDDAKTVFEMDREGLKQIFGNNTGIINAIINRTTFDRAEKEIAIAERHKIRMLFFTDADYPQMLNQPGCEDSPAMLFVKGDCNLNYKKGLSIVGTRRATNYGKDMVERIVSDMEGTGITIISGLAYGIDTASHKAALRHGLPTIAVMGHGLDQIYPTVNRNLATDIVRNGGAIVTEYLYGTKISSQNFPARNRIIAGLGHGTLVAESSEKGGSLITASMANGYNRDVFAVPGRVFDTYSKGCNNLIADNKAIICRSYDDICYYLNWEKATIANTGIQASLFPSLTEEEEQLVQIIETTSPITFDELHRESKFPIPKLAAILLNLELKDAIHCLPGKLYVINNSKR